MELIEQLYEEVIDQIGDNYEIELETVYNHGPNGGTNGFTWYEETVQFYDRNRKLILQYLFDGNKGCSTIDEFIGYMFKYSGIHEIKVEEVLRTMMGVPTKEDGEIEINIKDWLSKVILAEVAVYWYDKKEAENEDA